MNRKPDISGYHYDGAELSHSHEYLIPKVSQLLNDIAWPAERRLFELGCDNGSVAAKLAATGYHVTGVDVSEEGIANANQKFPRIALHRGSAYDDLAAKYGQFPALLSMEVVEHLYAPREFAKTAYDLLLPGGIAIITTPYHGYWKNLAMAVTGQMDRHFTVLWDHGHIKFWSFNTLTQLLKEVGFVDVHFYRVGRIPMIAKSMIAVARKPQ
jgi:2-polyprenyl-6-hydroxyphenyl methylase/3-demethylubiquinone-9 3-methyltransferase